MIVIFFILANLGWSVDHLGWNHQEVVTISGNPNSACFRRLCWRHFMDCERSSTAFPSWFCPSKNISSWWWKKCLPKPGKSQLVHSKLLQDRAIFWMWSQVPGGFPGSGHWQIPGKRRIASPSVACRGIPSCWPGPRWRDESEAGRNRWRRWEVVPWPGDTWGSHGITWDHQTKGKCTMIHRSGKKDDVFQVSCSRSSCCIGGVCPMTQPFAKGYDKNIQKLESSRDSVRRTLLLFSLRIGWYVVQS